nr:M50 family metallopeptidase [Aliiroseovarius subalbicans]
MRGHWQLIALTALVVALWTTPVMLPLRILVVFLHELSHGLAALLTGGSIEAISLSPNEGGLTTTRGGNLFAILSAGYLGSLVLGVTLFLAALRSRADRVVVGCLGAAMLVIAALWMREGFALAFTLGTGIWMLVVARFFPHEVSDMVLRVIGLTSMIYVPLDITSDTIARAHLHSDAYMLAERVGGATMLWGGLWLVISLIVIGGTLWFGSGPQSNLSFARR